MRKGLKGLFLLTAIAALTAALIACGGDDDSSDNGSSNGNGGGTTNTSDDPDTPLGSPCDLVTAADVEAIIGVGVQGTLMGVGDGLPGSMCVYSGTGVQVNLGYTPDGAGFYNANKSVATDVQDLSGVGDEAFLFLDTEIQAVSGDTLIIVSKLIGDFGMADQGAELANSLIAALP